MSGIFYKKMQSVYIVEKEDGAVKIGISQDVQKRIRALSKQGGFKVVNQFYTEPCSNAHEIEREMHLKYKRFRIDGEWFKISFDTGVSALKNTFNTNASFSPKEEKILHPEDIEEIFAKKTRRN